MNQIYDIEKKAKQNKIEKTTFALITVIVIAFLGYGGYKIYHDSKNTKIQTNSSDTSNDTSSVTTSDVNSNNTTNATESDSNSGKINGAEFNSQIDALDKSADSSTENDFDENNISDTEIGL